MWMVEITHSLQKILSETPKWDKRVLDAQLWYYHIPSAPRALPNSHPSHSNHQRSPPATIIHSEHPPLLFLAHHHHHHFFSWVRLQCWEDRRKRVRVGGLCVGHTMMESRVQWEALGMQARGIWWVGCSWQVVRRSYLTRYFVNAVLCMVFYICDSNACADYRSPPPVDAQVDIRVHDYQTCKPSARMMIYLSLRGAHGKRHRQSPFAKYIICPLSRSSWTKLYRQASLNGSIDIGVNGLRWLLGEIMLASSTLCVCEKQILDFT